MTSRTSLGHRLHCRASAQAGLRMHTAHPACCRARHDAVVVHPAENTIIRDPFALSMLMTLTAIHLLYVAAAKPYVNSKHCSESRQTGWGLEGYKVEGT
jgi:hypothetical protein